MRLFIAVVCFGFACLGTLKAKDLTLKVDNKNYAIESNGIITLKEAGKKMMSVGLGFYSTGWTPCYQFSVKEAKIRNKSGAKEISGVIFDKRSKSAAPFIVTAKVKGKKLSVGYKLTVPQTVVFEKGSKPILSLRLPSAVYREKAVKFGSKTAAMPANNVWSSGTQIMLPPADISLTLSEATGISAWKGKNDFFELRANMKQLSENDKVRVFETKLTIQTGLVEAKTKKKVTIKKPKDSIKVNLEAYERLLAYPQLDGFSPDYGFKLLNEAKTAKRKEAWGKIRQLEDWFSLRCENYDVATSMHLLKIFDKTLGTNYSAKLEEAFRDSLKALNSGDIAAGLTAVRNVAASLEQTQEQCIKDKGFGFQPLLNHNRLGWLKSFPTMGFSPHAEGMLTKEPLPWQVDWGKGLSVSLASATEGVLNSAAKSTSNKSYKGVDFTGAGNKGYNTRRSWTTNEWIGENRIIFSVLSPLIMIEDTDKIDISGLMQVPDQILLPEDGKLKPVSISSPKKFVPGEMKANWFICDGSYYTIGVICSRQPEEIKVTQNGIEVIFKGKASIRIINLSSSLKEKELFEEVKFWSEVAMAVPLQVVEEIKNKQVTYKYLYSEITDSWGTKARKIAPIPPLAILGKASVDGKKTAAYQTRYGAYSYVEGDSVSYEIPAWKRPMRGVNIGAHYSDKQFAKSADWGVDWVRAFGKGNWKPEEGYAHFKNTLENARAAKLKVLVDPHDFIFCVHKWTNSVPSKPEERQKFLDLWDKLSKMCKDYPDVVVGYDIYNELKVRNPGWPGWNKLANECIEVIRKNDPKTTIYVTGLDMANASGYKGAKPVNDKNVRYSFHMYAPHSYTHQKIHYKDTSEPFAFFPGWIPVMDWGGKTHYGKAPFTWWDRWELAACNLLVIEFSVKYNVEMHCGEFGVIGYSKKKGGPSAMLWTRDTMDFLERYGMNWHLWNMGFGLCIPEVKEEMFKRWQDK